MGLGVTERLRLRLEDVHAIAVNRLDPKERDAFATILQRLVDCAAPEDLLDQPAEELYGGALALWHFCAQRKPGALKIRLYNPRVDEHGWSCEHSVLEIVNDDMPFLVDSVTSCLTENGLEIHSVLHPVIRVRRDAGGMAQALLPVDAEEGTNESLMQVQLDQILEPERLSALCDELREALGHVRLAVEDWRPMVARVREATEALRANAPPESAEMTAEAAEFLDWLADNHFTFLGCRDYAIDSAGAMAAQPDSGLGLMRDADFTVFRDAAGAPADWTPEADVFLEEPSPLLVLKGNRRSDVHRAAHLDVIGVKRFSPDHKLVGELGIVGLFTKAAYNRSPHNIPLLRGKISRIIGRSRFARAGHDAKALDHVLETYPRDELFQASEEQLFENAIAALHLMTRPRTRLLLRPDRFDRFMSCIVYVPRERYSTELREKICEILSQAVNGRVANWTPAFSDRLTRVHIVVATTGGVIPDYDAEQIEAQIVEAVRSWTDMLHAALVERHGAGVASRLSGRYAQGFSAGYRDATTVSAALGDIEKMEALTADAPTALKFYRRLEDPGSAVRLKLYNRNAPVPLSDCIPMLENLGLRILEEHPHKVATSDSAVFLHDFLTCSKTGAEVDLAALRQKLEDAFAAVWRGEVNDDAFNRLVLQAGLTIRETALLRSYSRYLRQARLSYSFEYMGDALAENPGIARKLVTLFETLFDPSTGLDQEGRDAAAATIEAEIEAALEQVASLDVDRILRRFRNAIMATLRTNYFQPDAEGRPKPYLSFKFDSGQLDDLPLPRPWREIFVYSPWVEGVHLRGGPVARGGLRWSDRKEDYRTEVLGLVKAQQVKNAVIVPVGSKGGFLPKQLPVGGSREDIQAEAIRSYRTFLSGLLDLTDNLVGGAVVPPASVIRRDDDDPYLVVAADKGTATFSDIANGIARDYGFWLDDAFASGGSNGYDHKGMGITARGAWEAVKRHFRELGHDTQSAPFTVIGVGDMSGDVFGNGMLLSGQIRLVAAFDHRDIFIDPSPDAAKSFAERKRLFEMGRSSWQDYDPALISEGGGVFSRSAKSIPLTPEIRALTGIDAARATPFELIQALLRAEADLLWFGGIGTYVKADTETHVDADDRANDAIRVDASQVRARVIGEGANLGVTQRGRIALSRRGVKINTDAVDNSAGVDCSDHEVNIKIALSAIVADGDMTEKQRNQLLAEMTDEVADLVLKTNYQQTLAISMVEARAPALLADHARMMRLLERRERLDRAVELLPDETEIAERTEQGVGLSRPEIAVLVAYAKIVAFDDLVASDLPDDPWLERVVLDYMPPTLRSGHRDAILSHRLRREIISTVVANDMVNHLGPSTLFRLQEETGLGLAEVARAYVIVNETFALQAMRDEVNALDNQASAEAQTILHMALSDAAAAQTMRVLLMNPSSITETVELYRSGAEEIGARIESLLSDFAQNALAQRLAPALEGGAPEPLARRVMALEFIGGALDIVGMARTLDREVFDAAEAYFDIGARLGLDWLRFSARRATPPSIWDKIAFDRLISDLRTQQSDIAERILREAGPMPPGDAVATWVVANAEAVSRVGQSITELSESGPFTAAKLAVALLQLKSAIG